MPDRGDGRRLAIRVGPLTGRRERRGQGLANDASAVFVPLGGPTWRQAVLGVLTDLAIEQVGALGQGLVPTRDRRAPTRDGAVGKGPLKVADRAAGEDGEPVQPWFSGPV